jgi:glutamine synthetase
MNRSTPIMVPSFNNRKSARVEIRMPDPKCDPYLTMARMLTAGMDGIRQQTDPGEPDSRNVYENTEGLDRLPATLTETVHELQRDEGMGRLQQDPRSMEASGDNRLGEKQYLEAFWAKDQAEARSVPRAPSTSSEPSASRSSS